MRDRHTLQLISQIENAHEQMITDVWTSKLTPFLWASAAQDHAVHFYDTRQGNKRTMSIINDGPVWSLSLGVQDTLLATGSDDTVQLFDLRQGGKRKMHAYADSFADAVTQVCFHPFFENQLITGSEDGIACLFDVNIEEEEDAILSMINVESAITKVTLFGPAGENIACLTGTETLDVWNLNSATRIAHFPNIRQQCTDAQVCILYSVFLTTNFKSNMIDSH